MKKLSSILIIIGLLVSFSPLGGRWYTDYRQKKMLDQWMNSADAAIVEADAAQEENAINIEGGRRTESGEDIFGVPDQQGNGSQQTNGVQQGSDSQQEGKAQQGNEEQQGSKAQQVDKAQKGIAGQTKTKQTVVGTIKIEKIKVNCIIVEGVKPHNLRTGIGHMPGTSFPGKPGNCVLTGHRSYTFGRFFNRLDELEVGDKIIMSDKKADYTYVVFERSEVLPTDLSILKSNKDESIATLVTCTPIYIASHRLIVKARLEGTALNEP
jgi:sortase A